MSKSTESHSKLVTQSGVFYVDGSCRPHNPGYIGWGIHGYFYQEVVSKAVVVESFKHTTHGYVNIAHELPQHAQCVIPTEYVDGFGSHSELMTNNVAEIQGLYHLLKFLEDYKLQVVRVYTDSEYLRTSMTEWCKRWEKNNWLKADGSPVGNRELLEKTYNLLKTLRQTGVDIQIYWIRSHDGHLGNERADILAGIGMNHSQERKIITSIETSVAKGYWKSEPDRNPYIAFSRLYFNSLPEYNQAGIYHLAISSDTDFIIGKPSASMGYSVIYLNEPDQVIEEIKKKQYQHSNGINVIALMKLDSVYSKQVYPWLYKYGPYAMYGQKRDASLYLVDKKPLTLEMNPAGLSLRALEHFAFLEEMLIGFKERDVDLHWLVGAMKITVHDITDKFFNITTDKKGKIKHELLPDFIVGFKNLSLDIEIEHREKMIPVRVPYMLGFDCLPRNNLKYLEDAIPMIYLLTWIDGGIMKYSTIIQSNFGVGIWSNYFANQIVLPS